jgi:hypothetical protein
MKWPGYAKPVFCLSGKSNITSGNWKSSLVWKKFLFFRNANQVYILPRLASIRGALAIVTKRGAGRGGRDGVGRRTTLDADGEVVWF